MTSATSVLLSISLWEKPMANPPLVIRFFAPVIDSTIHALLNAIDQSMREGRRDFLLLLSTPGGASSTA